MPVLMSNTMGVSPAPGTARADWIIATDLATHLEHGLAQAEAGRRLAAHGANELSERPHPGFLALLWDQFNNYLVIILVIGVFLAADPPSYRKGLLALAERAKETHGAFLVGDAPSLADVCLVPQMYNARRFNLPLGPYPKLVAIDAAGALRHPEEGVG